MNETTDQELDLHSGRDHLADIDLQAHNARQVLVFEPEKDNTRSMEKSEKRFRSSFEGLENKRNVKSKKNPKPASSRNTEEVASLDPQSQTLNSWCSEDDSKYSRALKTIMYFYKVNEVLFSLAYSLAHPLYFHVH